MTRSDQRVWRRDDQGAQALPDVAGLMRAVREFDEFTEDNDPRAEHDFGSIVL
jgi:hypothetical protein